AMGCAVRMTDGEMRHVSMGSYGVGVSRLAGAMIEASHDGRGIIWHPEVAPFTVGISIVSKGDMQAADGTTVDAAAQQCAEACVRAGLSVLIDDRSERAGVKFADLDLIGLPFQVVIGKGFATDGTIEWRYRGDEARTTCTSIDDVVTGITSELQARKRA
nr:proline--tRNA ligase [Actinomycetes bacterium]